MCIINYGVCFGKIANCLRLKNTLGKGTISIHRVDNDFKL